MFSELNSIWNNFKCMIRFDDNNPLSIVQGNSTNKPNAVLTSNVQDPKMLAQDKLITTGELKVNSLSNVLDSNAQDVNFSTSESNVSTSSNTMPNSNVRTQKHFYNIIRSTGVSQYAPTQSVFAKEDDINDSKSWNNLVKLFKIHYVLYNIMF